jgi:glycosyltransferase involved in cell wall biosynthesis
MVADSIAIQAYLEERYGKAVEYISYAAAVPERFNDSILTTWGLQKHGFDLLIARMEPENNLAMILDGVVAATSTVPVIVIGNTNNRYGNFLLKRYADFQHIKFMQGLYDTDRLNALRRACRFYFHGHSVGGTNPSLLEAMAAGASIVAHDNRFNRAVLGENAMYFSSSAAIAACLHTDISSERTTANIERIQLHHRNDIITEQYEELFIRCRISAAEKGSLLAI